MFIISNIKNNPETRFNWRVFLSSRIETFTYFLLNENSI
ncbi:hypothetical protein BSBH6_01061 [Bacillus subtilis]|nr:hypothetical protein BSBH6_01061 [Bacillus subtilis]